MNQTSMTPASDTTPKKLFTFEEAAWNSIADSINRRDDSDALFAIDRLRRHLIANPLHARTEPPTATALNAIQPAPVVAEPVKDGLSKIAQRASDLSCKSFMPWQEAEELALSEFGVSPAQILEVIQEFPDYSPNGAMHMSQDDILRFAMHMLVFSPLNTQTASGASQGAAVATPKVKSTTCHAGRIDVVHMLANKIRVNAEGALANIDTRAHVYNSLEMIAEDALQLMGDDVTAPLDDAGVMLSEEKITRLSDLLREVTGCFTRDDGLPNDLLNRIDSELSAEVNPVMSGQKEISRAEWIEQAKAFYVEAGDDEATAIECARYICNEQDWAGSDIGDPREQAQEDIQGRGRTGLALLAASLPAEKGPVIAKPPLTGRWHHGQGYLVSGTIRISRWDCDTNPPVEFRDQLLEWMCETLNGAVNAYEVQDGHVRKPELQGAAAGSRIPMQQGASPAWRITGTDGWSASHESNDNTCFNAVSNGEITLLVVSRDDDSISFEEAGGAHDKSVATVLALMNAGEQPTPVAHVTGTRQ